MARRTRIALVVVAAALVVVTVLLIVGVACGTTSEKGPLP